MRDLGPSKEAGVEVGVRRGYRLFSFLILVKIRFENYWMFK
jgi:hypothetical protein